MLKGRRFVWAASGLLVLVASSSLWAAPGDLDASFGSGGIVITTSLGASGANAIVQQPDDKLVVVGHTVGSCPVHGAPMTLDLTLMRHNVDGSLDGTFGTGGIVRTGRSDCTWEDARSVVLQPDGKIVAGGQTVLARYQTNGVLDATFGSGGIVADVSAFGLVLQPDSKFVTAGLASTAGNHDFLVARYDAAGGLDATFGSGGVVRTAIGSDTEDAYALALQPDAKLVAAGYTYIANRDMALIRYEDDGSLDGTFGTGGIVVAPNTPSSEEAAALVVQPDGKLVAGGRTQAGFSVVRYEADGSLDATFGTGGIASVAGLLEVKAVALRPNGKIVAAGSAGNAVAVAVFNPNGSSDPTFGSGGLVTTSVSTGAYTNALIVQSDGKLVVAGETFPARFFLVRYEGPGEEIVLPLPTPTSTAPTPTPTVTVSATPTVTATPTPTTTATPLCAAGPASDCRKPTRALASQLQWKDNTPVPSSKDSLSWKWTRGAATAKIDFGNPTLATSYALCVYERSVGVSSLVLAADIPPNAASGLCLSKPCWRSSTRGFKYFNKAATPDGIVSVLLKEGTTGRALIKMKGKGASLPSHSLPLAQDPTVTVQLVNDLGICWDADYSAPAGRNSEQEFKDRSD